ncbi:MAG: DNA-3-methyladenine glycosylase 2 family protein, partial [Acidimicrobiia bacterium]|nr:DNA-3-methyladenine glycosylase 2 family protein [Acidimicrobiia bacterium]
GAVGEPLEESLVVDDEVLTAVFPGPGRLRTAPDSCFSMPAARRDTVRRIAAAVDDGAVRLDPGVDVEEARAALLALKGVGPWTADYVAMRGLGDPDRFLSSDLGVRHALTALGLEPAAADRWAPWRSYAVHHLWASLGAHPSTSADHPTIPTPSTKQVRS